MYAFEVSSASTFLSSLSDEASLISSFLQQYLPGNDGFISWFSDDKHAWTYKAAGMGPNADAQVSMRPVPQEPMASSGLDFARRDLPQALDLTSNFLLSVHSRELGNLGKLRSG